MARPPKPIDPEQVRKLAEKQWSDAQIAAVVGIHQTNLRKRFAIIIDEGRHSGKAKLIDILWQRAVIDKSDRMLEHALNRFLGPIPTKVQFEPEELIEANKAAIAAASKDTPDSTK
jgi:hypothetical protein